MTTLFSDDFSGVLVVGSGLWGSEIPPADFLGGGQPFNSGGTLHFTVPGPILYSLSTQLATFGVYPLRCTRWTWNIADIPLAAITATDDVDFTGSFGVTGQSGGFSWQLRYEPASVPPPGDVGTDTTVRLYPSGFVTSPPVADAIDGTPELDFDISSHKYLRIVEECHTVTWQYSADGATWTDHHTYDLDDGYIYVDHATGSNDTVMTIGFRGFNYGSTFETQVESALGESIDDCPCKQSGWHIGRVGSGGQF